MQLFVVAGFLGSGKTSFLKLLATAARDAGRKAAILENEAGQVGLDDQFLAESGFQVLSMLGGCACCDLQARLIDVLGKIQRENSFQLVLFEPSGVATVDGLLAALSRYAPQGMEIYLVSVLDATRFDIMQKAMGKLLQSQLSLAGQVVISKADLVEEEQLGRVLAETKRLAPMAQVEKANLLAPEAAPRAGKILEFLPPIPPLFLPAAGGRLFHRAQGFSLELPGEGMAAGQLEGFVGRVLAGLAAGDGGFLGHVKLLAHDAAGGPALVSGTGQGDVSTRGAAGQRLFGPAELTVIAASQAEEGLPPEDLVKRAVDGARAGWLPAD